MVRTKGSHVLLRSYNGQARVTVPMHHGILKPKTFASILKQAGISVDEFLGL